MFKVDVASVEEYFGFDPTREPELRALDAAILTIAPSLTRSFHPGTPAGEPGMRFKMISYGRLSFPGKKQPLDWPVLGVALQKNYISVYCAVSRSGRPLVDFHAPALRALRVGQNNFSFVRFADLDAAAFAGFVAEAAAVHAAAPETHARVPV